MFGIFFILAPFIFLVFGLLFAIFPDQSAANFCKLGKATWKITTFGLTDMHWFYREEKTRRTMRPLGIGFCFFGALFAVLLVVSYSGPNSLAAMREAGSYLNTNYGTSMEWNLACRASPNEPNAVDVQYRYAGKTGTLHGTWMGKHYTFTENR